MSWINDDFDKIIERMFKRFGVDPTMDTDDPNVKTWNYGYTMTMGPDGKPVVREFGTGLPQTGFTLEEPTTMETLSQIDVDRENGRVRLLVEMPGVAKESIRIKATDSRVRISAGNETKDYDAEIPLDAEVDPDSAKATYNNGVLDVTFKLVKAPEDDGVDVKVE
jgi:HSP20 family protein